MPTPSYNGFGSTPSVCKFPNREYEEIKGPVRAGPYSFRKGNAMKAKPIPRKKQIVHLKNAKAKFHVGTKFVEVIVRIPVDKLLRALSRRHHVSFD
jgi:hypothetical protein